MSRRRAGRDAGPKENPARSFLPRNVGKRNDPAKRKVQPYLRLKAPKVMELGLGAIWLRMIQ